MASSWAGIVPWRKTWRFPAPNHPRVGHDFVWLRIESHGFWDFFWGAIYGSIRTYWLDCRWRNVEDWSKKQLWWNRGKCKSQIGVILWEIYLLWRDCSGNFEGCKGYTDVYRLVNARWIAWLIINNNLFYPPEDRDLTWFNWLISPWDWCFFSIFSRSDQYLYHRTLRVISHHQYFFGAYKIPIVGLYVSKDPHCIIVYPIYIPTISPEISHYLTYCSQIQVNLPALVDGNQSRLIYTLLF